MYNEQPVLPPAPIVRLPQIPPQQVVTKRQKYARPVLTRYTVPPLPVTPRPGLAYPPFETRLPDTPPIASLSSPATRTLSAGNTSNALSPRLLYIPRAATSREPGLGESLMGCALLLLIAAVVLVLLYYLSSPG
ncbi:MAG TPA: hypothetical protein VKV20_15725 [Ktedonobacteraceae bacterium]|jgi:hypothetical protein|nr:hypothetical protein [Ktedonobacteraceae bacterium]